MRKKNLVMAAILIVAVGCTKQEVKQAGQRAQDAASNARDKAADAIDIAVPLGPRDDPAAREQERLDEKWRELASLREAQAATPPPAPAPAAPPMQIAFAPNGKESFKGLDANAINSAPVVVPLKGDVAGPSVLKTQVFLDRSGFSVGALDGRWGRNTAIALFWFQKSRGLNATDAGALDEQTYRTLAANAGADQSAVVQYALVDDDVKGPFVTIPEDVYDKAKLDCLCYESMKEKLAERFHTTAEFLDVLNPNADFSALHAGDTIWVPNVRGPLMQDNQDIAKIVISIRGNTFNAFDAAGNLVFHSPTTLGSKYDPSPRETVEVKKVTLDPWFHYQPTLFHEVPDHEPEANLAPGPNSPVGVVWIALSKPHFGIHGTSDPDSIGYASSHGCVRLTNWDARDVAHRVKPGVVVEFVDTRTEIAAQ